MKAEVQRQGKAKIQDYEPIVGRGYIEALGMLADRLRGKTVQNISAAHSGGQVAETLSRLVPLYNQLGVDFRWAVIKGNDEFFRIARKFHNALRGQEENPSADEFSVFLEISQRNLRELDLYGDLLFIHDPEPLALVTGKKELGKKWLWRCHLDVSNPRQGVWHFLRDFVVEYDATVFSSPGFAQDLPVRRFLIPPSIDPLSDRNRDLSPEAIDSVLRRCGVDEDKPVIVQMSGLAHSQDLARAVTIFERVKRTIDCQLLLAVDGASENAQSEEALNRVRKRIAGNPGIGLLLIPPGGDIDINALQRAATVVMHQSSKEGFALTVSEALWKGKPVVASAVGGVPLQVKHGFTGLLTYSIDGAVHAVRQLLTNKEYASWLGENGRQHVRQNFLITRELRDYLLLFLSIDFSDKVIYL